MLPRVNRYSPEKRSTGGELTTALSHEREAQPCYDARSYQTLYLPLPVAHLDQHGSYRSDSPPPAAPHNSPITFRPTEVDSGNHGNAPEAAYN